MSIKEKLAQELDSMSETELEQIAEYMAFFRFRARHRTTLLLDEAQLDALYSEFADEDRELAEEAMSDYTRGLLREQDKQKANITLLTLS